jgi:hypothetical protein
VLFKFKSKACADLIMLEADGRRILKAMTGTDPVQGIVRVADMPSALARLEAAVAHDEALRKQQSERLSAQAAQADPDAQEEPALASVSLAQRAAPMLQMLRRSLDQQADLVWGV